MTFIYIAVIVGFAVMIVLSLLALAVILCQISAEADRGYYDL